MSKTGTAVAVALGVLAAMAIAGVVGWGLSKAGVPVLALPVRQAA